MSFLKIYLAALIVFCAIDFLWVGIIARHWYHKEIGGLLVDSVRWLPVVGFYLLYAAALVVFAIDPAIQAQNWLQALGYGAFLGLISYAAYDLTNLATLKDWPVLLAICDMLWGAFVSGISSLIVYSLFKK